MDFRRQSGAHISDSCRCRLSRLLNLERLYRISLGKHPIEGNTVFRLRAGCAIQGLWLAFGGAAFEGIYLQSIARHLRRILQPLPWFLSS
jgi:hypothetical protein